MLGTLQVKSRPLRFGLLVDLNKQSTIERAIALNSTLWGGFYNPLIPVFGRTPRRWTDKPFPNPPPRGILSGYLDRLVLMS